METKYLEAYYSMSTNTSLVTLRWQSIKNQGYIWEKLFEILIALSKQQRFFRSLTGNAFVDLLVHEAPGDEFFQQLWNVVVDEQGIRQLQERYYNTCKTMPYIFPSTLALRFETELMLPANINHIRLLAFDYGDLEHWELVNLRSTIQQDLPEGFTAWQTINENEEFEEEAVIYMKINCELSQYAQEIDLTLHSRFDLWRPVRFDGVVNEPCLSMNIERLKQALMNLAVETGGALLDEAPY